jgi:hypothetical protein
MMRVMDASLQQLPPPSTLTLATKLAAAFRRKVVVAKAIVD